MTKLEIDEFIEKVLMENSYSDWLYIKQEFDKYVDQYEEEIINKDPYLIAQQKPTRLGYCKSCGLYVSLISYDQIDYFCYECFMNVYEKPWKEKSTGRLKELREEEREKLLKTRFERRHAKGLCPLNLRH